MTAAGRPGTSRVGPRFALPVRSLTLEHAHVGGLDALASLLHVELDDLPLVQRAVAGRLDRGEVYEHVLAAVTGDEAVTLVRVEPLDGSNGHESCPSLPFARRYQPTPAECHTGGKRQARPRYTRDETLNLCARHGSTPSPPAPASIHRR